MSVEVTPLTAIDWSPATTKEEIIQNVRTIISTVQGSVPLDRAFGIDQSYIDQPQALAQMAFRMLLVDAIERYETRVQILKITFEDDTTSAMDGKLIPHVIMEIKE